MSASVWIKTERMFPLIPRQTPRWSALYRRRSAVEREFGRLKNEWRSPRFASVDWTVFSSMPI